MATFIYPQQQISIVGGATEAKQDVMILELQEIEADIETAVTELQDIEADIEAGNAAQATSIKQDDIIAELQDIEADIEAGNLAQATAANQATVIAELQDIDANTADVSTETTLSALNAKVTAIDTTGKATEAKQDTIIAELQDIDANTADAATETTLAALNAKVTAVDTTALATSANQTTANASLSTIETDITALNARLAGNLVPETFDYIAVTYVAAGNGVGEIETAVYRTGGAAGTIVATLTLAYDGSDRLSSVTRS